MKNKLLIIAFSAFFFSCENDYEKLKGHWHLYEIIEYPFMGTRKYYTIDFKENQLVLFDNNGIYSNNCLGELDWSQNNISFNIDGLQLELKFEWKNDSLFFHKAFSNEIFFAEKCEESCCDKQKDFFVQQGVSIDLPIVTDTSGLFHLDRLNTLNEGSILIGVVKNIGCFGPPELIRIKFNDIFTRSEDSIFWFESLKQRIPHKKQHDIFFTIYSNKETDYDLFFETLNELKSLEIKTVYLALRNEDIKKEFKVWRKKIDLNDPHLKTIIENYYEEF
ncbi:MAG: hypothetical protein AAFZ15_05535 [Bacteroidota bacterium]